MSCLQSSRGGVEREFSPNPAPTPTPVPLQSPYWQAMELRDTG